MIFQIPSLNETTVFIQNSLVAGFFKLKNTKHEKLECQTKLKANYNYNESSRRSNNVHNRLVFFLVTPFMEKRAIIDRVFPSIYICYTYYNILSDRLRLERLETSDNAFFFQKIPLKSWKKSATELERLTHHFNTNTNNIVLCDSNIFTPPRKTVAVRYNICNASDSNETFRIIFHQQRIPGNFALKKNIYIDYVTC